MFHGTYLFAALGGVVFDVCEGFKSHWKEPITCSFFKNSTK